jgi:two-component system alkaline phosphatase synthesis response regulator PhoP
MPTFIENKKILLIDDEPDILEFLSYNFKKNGFAVTIANDGREGIEQAESTLPHLIVSDILMPGVSGIEMCKLLRNKPAFKDTPIIFLTAVNDDYQVMHAMLSGGDQYVAKPVRFDYLLALVREILKLEVPAT